MGSFSDYRVHKWLPQMTTIWLALHYDNPQVAGAYSSELFAGSYTRMLATVGQPSNRGLYIISDITFAGLPASRITHVAGWDSLYNGNMEFSAELASPLITIAGASKTFPSNSIALSIG